MTRRAENELPANVVFYDGVCGFCDGMVQWLLARDGEGRLHYAPLQGSTAQRTRTVHPGEFPEGPDTLVLVESAGARPVIHLRSRAVFRTLELLGGPWRAFGLLRILPRFLSESAYRLFARSRYVWFGRLETCRIPTPDERARFLP
jgi:predicted DCC family thiol-disulfide oxidoreductase YuxK